MNKITFNLHPKEQFIFIVNHKILSLDLKTKKMKNYHKWLLNQFVFDLFK